MVQDFTQETLLLYAYNELDPPTAAHLEQRLTSDPALKAQLNEIRECQNILGTPQHTPHDTTIQIILEESGKSQLEIH